jgi:hypothetical protein
MTSARYPTEVKFTMDRQGVGELLNSDKMRVAMEVVAEEIRLRAMVLAPVSASDKHPGRYKASFHVRSQRYGGATRDRAEAIVYNDSPEGFYVEFGHRGREPYHILASAAFVKFKGTA